MTDFVIWRRLLGSPLGVGCGAGPKSRHFLFKRAGCGLGFVAGQAGLFGPFSAGHSADTGLIRLRGSLRMVLVDVVGLRRTSSMEMSSLSRPLFGIGAGAGGPSKSPEHCLGVTVPCGAAGTFGAPAAMLRGGFSRCRRPGARPGWERPRRR